VSLFDQLVNEALRSRADLSSLRPAVEKELLHHDILREMSGAGLLAGLTFIGGTCLRACYGSSRLSEDLDFTGGNHFRRGDLAELGKILTERLKIQDHKREAAAFVAELEARIAALREEPDMRGEFMKEMRRFLPAATVRETIETEPYWSYLTQVVTELGRKAVAALPGIGH
jgi:hypothetical protein